MADVIYTDGSGNFSQVVYYNGTGYTQSSDTATIYFGPSTISESGEDPRSEARRWLDERVEEVRGLAWG